MLHKSVLAELNLEGHPWLAEVDIDEVPGLIGEEDLPLLPASTPKFATKSIVKIFT